jgi:energy-coupling factor transporter ATP-binding protein EcfA2
VAIDALEIDRFTAFTKGRLQFVDGVNVLIGANGTGKTHLLKLAYSSLKASERADSSLSLAARIETKLAWVFRPDDQRIARLVQRRHGRDTARVRLDLTDQRRLDFTIGSGSRKLRVNSAVDGHAFPSIFLPSREVLAMYEGFTTAWTRRELSFDETYFNTALALGGSALKGPTPAWLRGIVRDLEKEVGGSVALEGGRFYVRLKDGRMEAHLVAEGLRKLASIRHLIANGSLRENAVLFWDEPEANLNPMLVTMLANWLRALALGGVQIFLATHDFLLARAISFWEQYPSSTRSPNVRFFGLKRRTDAAGVSIHEGSFLSLPDNHLIDAYLRQNDEEQRLISAQLKAAKR